MKKIREHAQEYLEKSYSRTTLRGLIEELDNANLVVSDDSKPKRWYQLSNNSIDLEEELSINESDIYISSFTENDLREWLNRSVDNETSIQNSLKNHVIDLTNGKRIPLLYTRCHFQTHPTSHATSQKTYTCKECGARFQRLYAILEHCEREHHVCQGCDQ